MLNFNANKLLSIEYTNCLRAIAILLVMISHFGGCLGTNLTTPMGGTGVAIFLFISGYGINESFKCSGLSFYWRKRIIRVFLPYFIFITFLYIIHGVKRNFGDYIIDAIGLKTTYWYVGFILKQYFLFYILSKYLYSYRFIFFILPSIYILFTFRSTEAEQAFSFLIGVMASQYGEKMFFTRNKIATICLISLFSAITFLAIKQIPFIRLYEGTYIFNIIQCIMKTSFACFFITILYFCKRIEHNRLCVFTSIISYELYLVHMQFLGYINKSLINVIVVIVVSYILAFIFNRLNTYNAQLLRR